MKVIIKNEYCDRSIDFDDIDQPDYLCNGMIDSHGHIMWLGMQLLGLNLENTISSEDVLIKAKKFYDKNPTIIFLQARGWNNENWANGDELTLEKLDSYFPKIPVFLTRVDGHAGYANTKTLELAKIDSDTKNPDGGYIHRDPNGKPTGLLVDNAIELVNAIIPQPSKDELKEYIIKGIDNLAEYGVTYTCDMDVHLEWLEAFIELAGENKLKIKIKQYYRGLDNSRKKYKLIPQKINNLEIAGVKFFADGAIGSRGAAMLEDYSDEPNNKGLFLIDEEDFYQKALEAANDGFEIASHAIGDAANRMVLRVYERLRNSGVETNLRIEHTQIVHPDDLIKFKELNVEAHIQPIHCISDEKMAEARLGERVKYSYPWKTLVNLGIKIYGGSDYPIESHDPLLGIKSLVNPKIKWQESEKLAVSKAIELYTV